MKLDTDNENGSRSQPHQECGRCFLRPFYCSIIISRSGTAFSCSGPNFVGQLRDRPTEIKVSLFKYHKAFPDTKHYGSFIKSFRCTIKSFTSSVKVLKAKNALLHRLPHCSNVMKNRLLYARFVRKDKYAKIFQWTCKIECAVSNDVHIDARQLLFSKIRCLCKSFGMVKTTYKDSSHANNATRCVWLSITWREIGINLAT